MVSTSSFRSCHELHYIDIENSKAERKNKHVSSVSPWILSLHAVRHHLYLHITPPPTFPLWHLKRLSFTAGRSLDEWSLLKKSKIYIDQEPYFSGLIETTWVLFPPSVCVLMLKGGGHLLLMSWMQNSPDNKPRKSFTVRPDLWHLS